MVQLQAKARQIKAKLAGDGAIHVFEERQPGCLETIAKWLRTILFYTAAFACGYVAGLLHGG